MSKKYDGTPSWAFFSLVGCETALCCAGLATRSVITMPAYVRVHEERWKALPPEISAALQARLAPYRSAPSLSADGLLATRSGSSSTTIPERIEVSALADTRPHENRPLNPPVRLLAAAAAAERAERMGANQQQQRQQQKEQKQQPKKEEEQQQLRWQQRWQRELGGALAVELPPPPEPPPSEIPEEFCVYDAQLTGQQLPLASSKVKIFPTTKPSNRSEVVLLARCLEAMLAQAGTRTADALCAWDVTFGELVRQVCMH
jgi:hypothetical protein